MIDLASLSRPSAIMAGTSASGTRSIVMASSSTPCLASGTTTGCMAR
jgi:hypothetical protein